MSEKTIVLTMYGKGEAVETISVGLIEDNTNYYPNKDNALRYCMNVNELELNDNNWIHARIINENEKIILSKPPKFDIINRLNDYSVQRLIRETDHGVLARALKNADDSTKEKIFNNMTKKAAVMLKEDMEYINVDNDEIKKSRDKVVETIQKLTAQGIIIFQ